MVPCHKTKWRTPTFLGSPVVNQRGELIFCLRCGSDSCANPYPNPIPEAGPRGCDLLHQGGGLSTPPLPLSSVSIGIGCEWEKSGRHVLGTPPFSLVSTLGRGLLGFDGMFPRRFRFLDQEWLDQRGQPTQYGEPDFSGEGGEVARGFILGSQVPNLQKSPAFIHGMCKCISDQ